MEQYNFIKEIEQDLSKWIQYFDTKTTIAGVPEYYGKDANILRTIIRSMEDVAIERGFDQLMFGPVASQQIFLDNLEYLGKRFLRNLVYTSVNGENGPTVLIPEGTMKSYDFIRRLELDKAKIFYSSFFTRNEDAGMVRNGKTRCFWQIGMEVFNHPLFNSSLEVIETAYTMLAVAGLEDAHIRITDKRILKGIVENYPENERKILMSIINKAEDNPENFKDLYSKSGGKSETIANEIYGLLKLIYANESDVLTDLTLFAKKSKKCREGVENVLSIQESLKNIVPISIIPFMAKSWDACDKLMFDGRYPGYDSAICGGGNLTYKEYKASYPKSGVGIGVTRVFDIIKSKMTTPKKLT